MAITVDNKELRTTREVAREVNSIFSLIETGQLEKVVVTQRGTMVGVIISLEDYERLTQGERDGE